MAWHCRLLEVKGDAVLDYYLANTALVYIIIGFGCTLALYFGYKRDFVGNFWMVLLLGIIGSFLGAVIDYFFSDIIIALTKVSGHINIFPALITACIVISIYHKVSSKRDR